MTAMHGTDVIEATTLYSDHNGSDKFYAAELRRIPAGGFEVALSSWARGKRPLNQGTKVFESEEAARRAYSSTLKSKINGSSKYRVVESGNASSSAAVIQSERDGQSAGVPVQLLNAIGEVELEMLLEKPNMLWQRKMNGWRNGVIVDGDQTRGFNRAGQVVPIGADIARAAIAAFPRGTILDAELLKAGSEDGRDVTGRKGSIYVFDLLALGDRNLVGIPFGERHALLTQHAQDTGLALAPLYSTDATGTITILPAASVKDAAQYYLWLRQVGAEGIVGRRIDAPVTDGRKPGERVAVKHRFYQWIDAFVIRENEKHSVEIAVFDRGAERSLGSVTIPPSMALPSIGSVLRVRYLPSRAGRKLDQASLVAVHEPSVIGREECTIDNLVYEGDQS